MVSIDSVSFNEVRQEQFNNLTGKVVRFAMDIIRKNLIKSLESGFKSKGENCNCYDRAVCNLPCTSIISLCNKNVLSVSIVHRRWRFERNEEGMYYE